VPSSSSSSSRRVFLLSLATASCVSLTALDAERARAQAAAPHISEDDPLAKALGYKSDGSAIDKSKYPTYKPGQTCGQCRFFQGKAGEAWGPCQVLGNKGVNAKGWCVSFSAKT